MDIVLFESKYPILFTCRTKDDIYLFICCTVTASIVQWIATKTNYDTLIALLEDKITIRDAFLGVTDEKILIEYDGENISYRIMPKKEVPDSLLPTAGEYMEAEEDEYKEELSIFRKRNEYFEYCMPKLVNLISIYSFKNRKITLDDEYYHSDLIPTTESRNIAENYRVTVPALRGEPWITSN